MKKHSETGIIRNITNFESLLSFISAYGERYNPSRESIKLKALQNKLAECKFVMSKYENAHSAYTLAVDARKLSFEPINKIATKVINFLKSSESSALVDESVQSIVRKLRGSRPKRKPSDDDIKISAANGIEIRKHSTAQLGHDNKLDHFGNLITLLSKIPEYAPNEENLKIETLTKIYTSLIESNKSAIQASIQFELTRNERNQLLYRPLTGLVDIAIDTKNYLKSIIGSADPDYHQVCKLKFKSK